MKRNLNHLTVIVIVIICFITNISVHAESETGEREPIKIDIPKKGEPNSKPRAPSRSFISCTYSKDYIELSLPADVEYMDVTLEQNGVTVWTDVVTIDEPRFEIPNLSGEVIITCITNNDVSYSGTLYF